MWKLHAEAALALRRAAEEARSKGQAAVDQFMAEVAFHGALSQVPGAFREAVMSGLITGQTEKHQFIGTFVSTEQNVLTNDEYAQKGQAIIASGAKWHGLLLSKIRDGSSFTITRKFYDALNNGYREGTPTYEITDQWRRGFDVAIGLCEGKAESEWMTPAGGLEQEKVHASLVNVQAQQGFEAGQAVQFDRTQAANLTERTRFTAKPEKFGDQRTSFTTRIKKFGDQ